MKSKVVVRTLLGCVVASFIGLAFTAFSFAWFFSSMNVDGDTIDGEVGLRDYFYNGDGYRDDGESIETAYEIVTPNHFYNLTRLQNLGVFSEPKYFRIGHNTGTEENPVYQVYDSNNQWTSFLDLTNWYNEDIPAFKPIGNESTPFYGIFDGSSIPVKGLKIEGYPEDVGVFGYTAYSSEIRNFVCTNLTVTSLGYSSTGKTNELYGENIDNIFDDEAVGFAAASLAYVDGSGSHPLKDAILDNNRDVAPVYTIQDLDSHVSETIIVSETEKIQLVDDGRFVPDFGSIEGHSDFKYYLVSSTGVVAIKHDNQTDQDYAVIDIGKLPEEFDDPKAAVRLNTTISVVASIKIKGYTYSRVIQSYNVEIYQTYDENAKKRVLNANLTCDFVTEDDGETCYNAKHGNNVGYLVGHADGNVINRYVYNGKLVLNKNNDQTLVSIDTQSETGLIGKIGKNVTSDIIPSGETTKGETGVLNFSYIYDQIRRPFVKNMDTIAGYAASYNVEHPNQDGPMQTFVSYAKDGDIRDDVVYPSGASVSSFNKYKNYLSTAILNGQKYYITSGGDYADIKSKNRGYGDDYRIPASTGLPGAMNSVDFTWNQIICDDSDETNGNRGLGVFRIVTGYSGVLRNGELPMFLNDLQDCAITRLDSGKEKKAIYFSTAECRWLEEDAKGNKLPDWTSITPQRMNTLPDRAYDDKGDYDNEDYEKMTTDVNSFNYPFSRDFDYLFKLNLNEADKFVQTDNSVWNYMYNTKSAFLQNYLKSILIDRKGKPITSGKGFGFKLQFSQKTADEDDDVVRELSSYMTLGVPGDKIQYDHVPVYNSVTGTWGEKTMYLPPKSITFSIDNPNGANVSIAGNGGYISIYEYDPDVPGGKPVEAYTMYSANNRGDNFGRYFEYSHDDFDGTTTNTKTVVTPHDGMSDSGYLFGHIFKLPKGHYVIGASGKKGSTSANIYYLSVQGQTNGDLGELDVTTIGKYVEHTDFLLQDPTKSNTPLDYTDLSVVAKFSFESVFTNADGAVVVDTYLITPDDPETQEDESVVCIQAKFNNCVTYLLFYCRKNEPVFAQNGHVIEDQQLYKEPYNYSNIEDVNWRVEVENND